jgi:hypothetical protein
VVDKAILYGTGKNRTLHRNLLLPVGHLPNRNIPDPSDEDQTEEESVFLETTQSAEIDGPSSESYTSQPELDEVYSMILEKMFQYSL